MANSTWLKSNITSGVLGKPRGGNFPTCVIEYLESHIVYENPRPHVHSRHGYFPGMVRLSSGELLCAFMLAEAFEAPNGTTHISRSSDGGRTWRLQGPLYDKSSIGFETTDALKATELRDGTLVCVGYRFHRHDLEQPIGIEETGGVLPGDNLFGTSLDQGLTWSVASIARTRPELLEISGPCIETASGDLLAVSAPLKMPDGANPSGQLGVLLRRPRDGEWSDREVFFRAPGGNLAPLESRIVELQPGRLVAIVWAYDYVAQRHHANHIVYSLDNGHTWSEPIDTGHLGQASSIHWLGGDLLASIHAHRGPQFGLFVRVVDFGGNQWRVLEEEVVWEGAPSGQTGDARAMIDMFKALRFGQPSLVAMGDDEFLAVHWAIEDGQGRIRAHRLRIRS